MNFAIVERWGLNLWAIFIVADCIHRSLDSYVHKGWNFQSGAASVERANVTTNLPDILPGIYQSIRPIYWYASYTVMSSMTKSEDAFVFTTHHHTSMDRGAIEVVESLLKDILSQNRQGYISNTHMPGIRAWPHSCGGVLFVELWVRWAWRRETVLEFGSSCTYHELTKPRLISIPS